MINRDGRHRRAPALRGARAILDRYAGLCTEINEQLTALAVALAIIVTLTAACRAPALLADRAGATSAQE